MMTMSSSNEYPIATSLGTLLVLEEIHRRRQATRRCRTVAKCVAGLSAAACVSGIALLGHDIWKSLLFVAPYELLAALSWYVTGNAYGEESVVRGFGLRFSIVLTALPVFLVLH